MDELKAQLYLLTLVQDAMEQTCVYDLHTPGKYAVSVIDNVLVVHNLIARVSMLFDFRSDPKGTDGGGGRERERGRQAAVAMDARARFSRHRYMCGHSVGPLVRPRVVCICTVH